MDEKPFDSQNAPYAQALYEEFARNPAGVPEAWRKFFDLGPETTVEAGLIVPEGLAENGGERSHPGAGAGSTMVAADLSAAKQEAHTMRRLLRAVAHATSFIQAYRSTGTNSRPSIPWAPSLPGTLSSIRSSSAPV